MPRYLTTARITQATAQGTLKQPEDREAVLRPLFEAAGAKLERLYISPDTMEVVEIWSSDNPAAIDALVLTVAAAGVIDLSTSETRRILTGAELAETARKAAGSGYRPPGG